MDDITASSPTDFSVSNLSGIKVLNGIKKAYDHLNELKILDSIKSHELSTVVTGNAQNKNINTIQTETKTTNDRLHLMEASLRCQKMNDRDHHHKWLAHSPFVGEEPDNTYGWKATVSSDVSISSDGSIDAYPLVEDEYPTEMTNVKSEVKIPNKKRLTPTSIMVVDTISEVKSRVLLKVLFDPGSTATLINRKCLPRNCKTQPINQERKINTLAGSCETKAVVVMRNLRLPELDKNRVVDQQKALVFSGKCKYDVILGADFLSKSGIDIKYSTGTIEWFDSELPMRDPHQLDDKEYLAMAESLYSAWIGTIQHATLRKYSTQNTAKYQRMTLQINSPT